MVLFCVCIWLGEKPRIYDEQNCHECCQVFLVGPDQAQDPEKCQSADETPYQGVQMPVEDRIAQETVNDRIDHAHEWTVGRKQWRPTLRPACLTGPQHKPVVVIVTQIWNAHPICNDSCQKNQQSSNEALIFEQFLYCLRHPGLHQNCNMAPDDIMTSRTA